MIIFYNDLMIREFGIIKCTWWSCFTQLIYLIFISGESIDQRISDAEIGYEICLNCQIVIFWVNNSKLDHRKS
jgi:hypothetical protein